MTTVAACVRNGTIYMAADTCTNVYDRPIVNGARKIQRHRAGDDEVLIAFAGAGGLPGVVAANLVIDGVPEAGEDPQSWASAAAVAITQVAVEAGLTESGKLDATLLLAWGGQLWTVTHAMAIPHPDGIAALGSGEGPAIGALDVLLRHGINGPQDAVIEAVQVAINRDRYSEGPIQVEVLPPSAGLASESTAEADVPCRAGAGLAPPLEVGSLKLPVAVPGPCGTWEAVGEVAVPIVAGELTPDEHGQLRTSLTADTSGTAAAIGDLLDARYGG